MLFVINGQPKSASTYLARMARYVCEAAGTNQVAIREHLLTGALEEKRPFWNGSLAPIPSVADHLASGEHMAIKTHSPFQPNFAQTFDRPDIQVFMSYRHPGDAALSAYEAGVRARAEGNSNSRFSLLTTHRKAIDNMSAHVNKLVTPWLKSGLAIPFSYHQVTREAADIVTMLRDKVGVSQADLDASRDLQDLLAGRQRTYNFNKGTSGRHAEVFSKEDLDHLHAQCGHFIAFSEGDISLKDL